MCNRLKQLYYIVKPGMMTAAIFNPHRHVSVEVYANVKRHGSARDVKGVRLLPNV